MSEIPSDIQDGLDRQDTETLETIIEYCRELIEEQLQAPEVEEESEGEEIVEKDKKERYTEVVKKVPCGKDCSGCPHGPYLYHVRREGKKLEWEYKGVVE
ncbi:MAG: hypothetical protein ABEK59_10180 [Halobacteria archaeon]